MFVTLLTVIVMYQFSDNKHKEIRFNLNLLL